jgi:hypothetical protein
MRAKQLNQHIERASSGLDEHEKAMAADIARAMNDLADDCARRFKENATSFMASAPPDQTWARPHPDEVFDLVAFRAAIDKAIEPHLDRALADFTEALPGCVPLKAREKPEILTAAQRALLASLADQAHEDEEEEEGFLP